jgi:hypothetical protein
MKQNKIPKNEYIRKPVGKTNPYKDDVIYSNLGQWKYPGQVTRIPSGDITMQGVPYPVYGEDDLGYSQMMYPGMDYQFPGQYVTEYPMAAYGGDPSLANIEGHYQGGGAQTPEEWETEIRTVEHKIGDPSQWTLEGYNELQNKLNEYKAWRENTPEGKAVVDYHNEPNEYVVPLPSHLQVVPKKPFGGIYSKTHTHMSQGGWLDEYPDGGGTSKVRAPKIPTSRQDAENMIANKELYLTPSSNQGYEAIKNIVNTAGIGFYPAAVAGSIMDAVEGNYKDAALGLIPFLGKAGKHGKLWGQVYTKAVKAGIPHKIAYPGKHILKGTSSGLSTGIQGLDFYNDNPYEVFGKEQKVYGGELDEYAPGGEPPLKTRKVLPFDKQFIYNKDSINNRILQSQASECHKGECLEGANTYINKYVAPQFGLSDTWKINEVYGIQSGNEKMPYGKSADSWDLAALLQQKGAIKNYAASLYNKDKKRKTEEDAAKEWQGLSNEDKKKIYNQMSLGTLVNYGDYGGVDSSRKEGANEKAGLFPSRHSARVVGFTEDGEPVVYDYGEIKPISKSGLGFPITNITTPKEYSKYNSDYVKKWQDANRGYDFNTNEKLVLNRSNIRKDETPVTNEEQWFVDGFNKNIEKIMQATGASQEDVIKAGKVAFGIMEGETRGGRGSVAAKAKEFSKPVLNALGEIFTLGFADTQESSKGLTRMKTDMLSGDETNKYSQYLKRMGYNPKDINLWDPETAALSTVALLLSRKGEIENVDKWYLRAKQHNTPGFGEKGKKYLQEADSDYANNVIKNASRLYSPNTGQGLPDTEKWIKETKNKNVTKKSQPVTKKNGGWLDEYQMRGEVLPSETTQSMIPAGLKYKMDQLKKQDPKYKKKLEEEKKFVNNVIKAKEDVKKQEVAERKARIADSIDAQKETIIGNPNWRENLARQTQAIGDKFRVSDEPNFFDDYINPGVWIGDMASGLGQAPYVAKETNSNLPYVLGVGAPLVTGALEGIGGKSTKDFITNLISPIPFTGEAINKGLKGIKKLPNALKKSLNKETKPFQSEVDWSKWNKEIPSNTQLMKEYNAIEKTSKANNTWMKNPDGSTFQGTPEQFVQQNSENFKKAFPEGHNRVYRGGNNENLSNREHPIVFTGDKKIGEHYVGSKSPFTGDYEIASPDAIGGRTLFDMYHPKNADNLIINNQGRSWREIPRKHFGENPPIRDLHNSKGDFTSTDDIAKWMVENDKNSVRLNNIDDSYNADFVDIINHKKGNYLKSATGNNGMFDMTNPNIYKALVPAAIATGAYQQEEEGGEIEEDEFRRGGPYTPPKLKKKAKKYGTSKNIQSSINKLFTRNYDVFGPSGKNIYNPNVYKTGGWLDNFLK